MNTAVVTKRIAEASPSFKARIAGALSLLSLLAAVFGEFVVRRLELVGDLIALSGMVALTVLLYYIFKPVNRGLSLLAASFNLVGLACGALRWNPRGVDTPRGIERILLLSDRLPHFQVDVSASDFRRADGVSRLGLGDLSLTAVRSPSVPLQSGCRRSRTRIGNAVASREGR